MEPKAVIYNVMFITQITEQKVINIFITPTCFSMSAFKNYGVAINRPHKHSKLIRFRWTHYTGTFNNNFSYWWGQVKRLILILLGRGWQEVDLHCNVDVSDIFIFFILKANYVLISSNKNGNVYTNN
jgi:hypothetical protein